MVYPLLTPLAIDPEGPVPDIPSLRLLLACRLKSNEDQSSRYAFVPIPENIPRFMPVQSSKGDCFVQIEDLVRRIQKVETAVEPRFQAHFVEAMAFPHKTAPFERLARYVDLPAPAAVEESGGGRARAGRRRRSR